MVVTEKGLREAGRKLWARKEMGLNLLIAALFSSWDVLLGHHSWGDELNAFFKN